ncbi:NAD(P)-dependent oxidoreductase [uncultured Nocardioides sp.]|uniref:NAD-dependent epimerase/dehydratase family protein n=1 Tax=uncultured Nocardioides sp. TaxID=198441 RepID=UPI00261203F7|nr:SDR family oxidoreductase [uncultured Nocardioides sp.]
MRVLVTGSDGYLGSLLVTELRSGGHDVATLDSGLYRRALLESRDDPDSTGDTRDVAATALAGRDVVVHLAELSNDPLGELDPDLTVAINHRGSVRLADLAAEAGVGRFVYFSSCSVYGATGDAIVDEEGPTNPLTAYARCKVAVEQDLLGTDRGDLVPVMLRNATVYGPSPALRLDLAINEFVYDAVINGAVRMRSAGTSWRPFVQAGDIAIAARALMEAPIESVGRQIVNVGSDEATVQVSTAAEIVGRLTGAPVEIADPSPDLRDYRVSFAKLSSLLPDLRMRPIEDGIGDLVAFVRDHADDFRARPKDDFFRLAELRRRREAGELDEALRRT